MQGLSTEIFNKLPDGVFRPLASANKALYWKVLVRLFHSYFDDDSDVTDQHRRSRTVIVGSITSVVEQNSSLWIDDDGDTEPCSGARARSGQVYRYFCDSGWLEETRSGYSYYVSMAPRVSQLLSALLEISEGRALIMTGKLKSLRSDMREALSDPESSADLLVEATKDAKRFSRHLGGIRGSIKSLYDQIKGNIPAKDIVSTFFDDFLSDILVRDYAAIKTTENPLSIRDELLRIVSSLRHVDEKKALLLKGYLKIYARESNSNASLYMEKDLSQLESVFSHIDNQLDAIDSMKLTYEQRVDTVIEYASRTPRSLGLNLKRLITALVNHAEKEPSILLALPLIDGERISQERLAQPKTPKTSPAPRPLKKSRLSSEVINRSKMERAARMMIHVEDKDICNFLDAQMDAQRTIEVKDLKPKNIHDYFCILALQRSAVSPSGSSAQPSKMDENFSLSATADWVENRYINLLNIIITRKT